MRNWALFLHFYQPATQNTEITKHVLDVCYLPVLELLLNHPEQHFSINFSGSLLIQLEQLGEKKFFEKVKTLAERGQIELVNSPTHHPLAPLTDWDVVKRQLNYDHDITNGLIQHSLTESLFLPELAIDRNVLKHIADNAHYEWCLIDESSAHPSFENDIISGYRVLKYNGLYLPVASRSLSEILRAYPTWINQHKLVDFIEEQTPDNDTIISANDVELFGHHYSERIHILRKLLEMTDRIKFVTISEAIKHIEPIEIELDQLTPSSWQTSKKELDNNTPFERWLSKDNPLQQEYHHLVSTVTKTFLSVDKPIEDTSLIYGSAEKHLDQGTASCHYYWLSNDPWWHPDLVEIGAKELIKVIRTLNLPLEDKQDIEKIYAKLIHDIWQYHWSGEVEKGFKLFSKSRQSIVTTLPDIA